MNIKTPSEAIRSARLLDKRDGSSAVGSLTLAVAVLLVLHFSSAHVSAQTFYVSSGSQTIDTVSAGSVNLFATLPANSYPRGLALDGSGNLYAAGNTSYQISKITPDGSVSLFATLFGAELNGLAFDGSGNLYVSNSVADQVIKITSGGAVSLFATLPAGSFPFGLAVDGSGNVYAADFFTNQISKITSGGVVSLFATVPGPYPSGLAFDGSGNLYSADFFANQISKISPDGLTVSTFATGINQPAFIQAVPEPSTWAAGFLTAGTLLCSIWRRRAG
jgi:streptogramin lyase